MIHDIFFLEISQEELQTMKVLISLCILFLFKIGAKLTDRNRSYMSAHALLNLLDELRKRELLLIASLKQDHKCKILFITFQCSKL